MEGVVIDSAAPERSGTFATPRSAEVRASCRRSAASSAMRRRRRNRASASKCGCRRQNWSGRYVQVGNGGLAGIIFHELLGQMLERGHATASTDNGHTGNADRRPLGDRAAGESSRLRRARRAPAERHRQARHREVLRERGAALVLLRVLGRRSRSADRGATISAGLRRHRCRRTRSTTGRTC